MTTITAEGSPTGGLYRPKERAPAEPLPAPPAIDPRLCVKVCRACRYEPTALGAYYRASAAEYLCLDCPRIPKIVPRYPLRGIAGHLAKARGGK